MVVIKEYCYHDVCVCVRVCECACVHTYITLMPCFELHAVTMEDVSDSVSLALSISVHYTRVPQNPVEYPWLTYTLLWAETDFEEDIWGELVRVLHYNQKSSLDWCMKKALEALHLHVSCYPSWHLAIFRWANLALALPMDCPVMVLVWQKLFNLHLQRPILDKRCGEGTEGERW